MSNPFDGVIAGFQDLVGQVPDLLQPFIVMVAGAVPFIEGEGSAMIGVIGGLPPLVAALAGAAGNLLSVVLVVLLSSRIRAAAVTRRERRRGGTALRGAADADGTSAVPASAGTTDAGVAGAVPAQTGTVTVESAPAEGRAAKKESKGRQKLNRWLVRFGVPGASLLAPLALPTQITAATLVASGIDKRRVILWQAIAIVLWTTVATVSAIGLLAVVAVV
ncbi:small multidrug efflux protein [Cryobacterium sp. 1639]|uniref:small multidrug efflux protein n=1 Tax=Cryobacterium inferilacus TaxID=2866629 RepID=UPI001C737064|nr:small multidrug efflux protein [Cryobacterium sp. 1639]MBX0301127.1 small multidrug efflux protein [Cryobacterium sp. 1639]